MEKKLLYGELFLFKFKLPKKAITCPCLEIGSLPEQVIKQKVIKQNANL